MKASFQVNDKLVLELEGATQSELFEELAAAQDVFGNTTVTNKDGVSSNNVKFSVRTDKEDNKYYELVCMEPGPLMYARQRFGNHKKGGGLFPKGRWIKYDPATGKEMDVYSGKEIDPETGKPKN